MRALRRPWLGVLLLLGGCATYQPLPLNLHVRALPRAADIHVSASMLRLFPPRQHRFNPGRGLDMTDVAILAVANNPQLKLARDERGIGRAQAFAAGLLPDPVLDLARGLPTAGPSEGSAFDLGLSNDVEALLVHPLAKQAAKASARQVDLNLLWIEWQVIGQARQLFVQDVDEAKIITVLQKEAAALTTQHARLVADSKDGDVSEVTLAADLAELQAVEARLHGAEREDLKTRHALNALLGLSPEAKLHLLEPPKTPALDTAAIARALDDLPRDRPDLLALQAGYASADARYRQAILAQFPAIQVGLTKARDADGVYTRGFQVSLSLPIFNRNRGAIAIAKATRKDLHDAYAVRLAQARAEVEQILESQTLLVRQRAQLQQALTSTSATLQRLLAVAAPGDIARAAQVRLQTNVSDRRLALLTLDESLLEQRVALQTLLGAGITAP